MIIHCKNKCKLTPKEVAAQLSPLWCKLTLTFLLKQLEINIFPVIYVKTFLPVIVGVSL